VTRVKRLPVDRRQTGHVSLALACFRRMRRDSASGPFLMVRDELCGLTRDVTGKFFGLCRRIATQGLGLAPVCVRHGNCRYRIAMKIDVNRKDDIQYWADRLGVSRAQLIAAVAAAGPEVRAVEARIRRDAARPREPRSQQASRRLAFHAHD
jgi:hypothetical protein